ncbi:hypothetical protein ANRL1_03800 [Anaerolineae bacterium]|nr:hypothetical protein ANRL1_03800 [Anaerolineae bacterium]
MSPQQKNILTTLILGNLVLFCCLAPAAYFVLSLPAGADPIQSAQATAQSFLPPTPTRRATFTPTRPVPTPTLVPGWKLTTISSNKFAIATPPSWEVKTLTPSNLAAQFDEIAKKNPQLANSLKGQSTEYVAKIKFIAYETSANIIREGFMPNVNVIRDSENTDMTLDDWTKASEKELASYKPSIRRVRASAGEILEIKFTIPMKLANNQTVNLASLQYLILRGREAYSLSCVALDKQAATYMPICEKIGLSVRWIN